MPKKPATRTTVTAHHHNDTRANIPTEELRGFVADDERNPRPVLYPRDPSLDPQLVWKGKDEQDTQDLEVPAVPIYIQEKISPQAIVEQVRSQAAAPAPDEQLSLFSDFNNITFEDLVDFYHHEQNWSNRMILGDSLLVMNSLAEKEGLKGRVQMIYIDPPYGIQFRSNWQVSTRKRDVRDGRAEDATRQPEQIKAFRDTWQLGIHSYLSYLRDRLVLARELLTESGSVFVQIGDENAHLVRCLLDEVFGSENFCAQINFRSMTPLGQKGVAKVYDYLLWYTKNIDVMKFHPLYYERTAEGEPEFCYFDDGGYYEKVNTDTIRELPNHQRAKIFKRSVLTSSGYTPSCTYKFEFEGSSCSPLSGKSWRTHSIGMKRLVAANRLILLGRNPYFRQYYLDFPVMQMENSWTDTAAGYSEGKIYVVQTSDRVIQRCMLMTTDPGDLVLDPTCGSGTTAYVAEQWGRRWITIDTSRVAIALARTRLMAGRFSYYLLADSPEGRQKERELNPQAAQQPTEEAASAPAAHGDLKRGFVYKRVPHITLKSIANNEEIDAIHDRWQPALDELRARINAACGKNWEEWEIPRSAEELPPAQQEAAAALLAEWWQTRRERQAQMDASIARRADTELLYDQPYEDGKRVRVTGPFTVESLSPHRVLSTDDARPASEVDAGQEGAGQFAALIIANLHTAGVQNTHKNERLKFDRLESFAGLYLQASGDYTDQDGSTRRVAVCIGPEYGTVGGELIREAAKEARQGVGFDLLVVLGFAFDPHVSEEVRRYGALTVLPARINPDLQMGGDLLKKTGSGNLFMVYGEPDVLVTRPDGRVCVEIRGLDVYDPTTGEIRSCSTDEIACWFIDTDYNGESFFVRQAYFTGADQPYEKLKRALRADVDEAAWSVLYSSVSQPFDVPAHGQIAVKVINHFGDEVLKVIKV